jgi:hypothetical protein
MMDNKALLQNVLRFQGGMSGDDISKAGNTGNLKGSPHTSIEGFPVGGLLHQYFTQQNEQKDNPGYDFQKLSSKKEPLHTDQYNQAIDDFPVGGLLHSYFMQQKKEQSCTPVQPRLPSSSFQSSINMNSLESLGSISRLFSVGNNKSSMMNRASNCKMNIQTDISQRLPIPNEKRKSDTWLTGAPGQADLFAQNGILGPWSAASAELLGDMAITSSDKVKKVKKKAKNKPKRPLSAYNVFFKEERAKILEEISETNTASCASGTESEEKKKPRPKIGFQNLAKMIGKRWKGLDAQQIDLYKKKAEVDSARYREEMNKFVLTQKREIV